MKVTLLTYGSRGDVQPFLALAIGLIKAGHEVTLAAPHRYSDFVSQYGVPFAPLAGDPDELSRMFNDAGTNTYRMVRSMQKHIFRIAPDVVRGARQALQGTDILVHSFAFTTGAHSFAREQGIPDVSVQMFPVFRPTRVFPAIGAPQGMPGWLNYFSHWFSTKVFWHAGNIGYFQLRRRARADFPRQVYWPFTPSPERSVTPLIFAISPVVLDRPPEWRSPSIHMPGYFFLDHQNYQPVEEMQRFLDSGEPPVCVTFGSMVNRKGENITNAALDGIHRTGNRAIFVTGWSNWRPESLPEGVFLTDSVPHDWLFPQCKTIIHHGGAGTTAAALRAGVPSILVPHAADQPFWGSRVAAIGAGPNSIPVNQLSAGRLEKALIEAENEPICRRAAEIGRQIRAEDGIGKAVALIEAHAREFYHSPAPKRAIHPET